MTGNDNLIVSADRFEDGVIEPSEFNADPAAFVEVRLHRSAGRVSYSFIGPGVSQNPDQKVNLVEPHGFNVGAATMPPGVATPPHLHYTAEVFICTRGSFRFMIGEHEEQTLDLGPRAIFAVPPWTFRGFTNTTGDDGEAWTFVVLGGDETGGILWPPHILRQAAETGLHLTVDHEVVESEPGAPGPTDALPPIPAELLAQLETYDDAAIERCVARWDDLAWSDRPLLSSVLEGHRVAIAPVLGHGLTEDRLQLPPIAGAQGFSVEWLRIEPGQSVGVHRLDVPQVLFAVDGSPNVTVNRGAEAMTTLPAEGSVISIPMGAWRNLANPSADPIHIAIVCGGDEPTAITWSDEIIDAAAAAGWARDPRRRLAPVSLLGRGDGTR